MKGKKAKARMFGVPHRSELFTKSKGARLIENTQALLGSFSVDEIETIYSGPKGCMCGCIGSYSSTSRGLKLRLANLKKFIQSAKFEIHYGFDIDDKPYIAFESADKAYVIYFKKVV